MHPALRAALEQSRPSDVVRAILLLHQPGPVVEPEPPPNPTAFPSRNAYRAALIERQERAAETAIRPILEHLRRLELHPRGGKLNAVLVEGPVDQFLEALDLPQVSQALPDERLTTPTPRRPGDGG
jgi:hypothetical protein